MKIHEYTSTSPAVLLSALEGSAPSWVALPSPDAAPPPLQRALEAFEAGDRPAALAATRWLKTQALDCHLSARTRVLVADHRVLGFYALASAHVYLRTHDRRRMRLAPVRVPATLIAWIAKDSRTAIRGRALLQHAGMMARHATAFQASTVLVVDPFDDATAAMWRARFGFRASAEEGSPKRLWLPLEALG